MGILICSSNQPWYDLSRYIQNNSYHDISGPAQVSYIWQHMHSGTAIE